MGSSLSREEQIIVGVTVAFAVIVIIIIILILVCVFVMKKEEKSARKSRYDYGGYGAATVVPYTRKPVMRNHSARSHISRPVSYVDVPYYYKDYENTGDRYYNSTQGYKPKNSYYEFYSLDRPKVHRPAVDWERY